MNEPEVRADETLVRSPEKKKKINEWILMNPYRGSIYSQNLMMNWL